MLNDLSYTTTLPIEYPFTQQQQQIESSFTSEEDKSFSYPQSPSSHFNTSALDTYLPSFLLQKEPTQQQQQQQSFMYSKPKAKGANIVQVFLKGSDKDKLALFNNKASNLHNEVKSCVQFQPELAVSAMYQLIRNNICEFFNGSDNGLSLELLKLFLREFNEKQTDDFLWALGDNYVYVSDDNKSKVIDVILLLFCNTKNKSKQVISLLLSALYLLSKNKDMFPDVRCVDLIHFIINQKFDYINEMLFKLILDYARQHKDDTHKLFNIKHFIIDKHSTNINKSASFKALQQLFAYVFKKQDTHLFTPASPQNLKEYLLSCNIMQYDPCKDEELTLLLLSAAKQQTYSKDLQDLAKEHQLIVNNIFTPFLIAKFAKLSMDKYAKFFVVETIEHFPEDKLPDLIQAIKPQFTSISTDKQGTRVIQAIIKRCYTLYCESHTSSQNNSNSNNSSSSNNNNGSCCFHALICLLENISANIVELMTNKLSAHIVLSMLQFQIPFVNDCIYQVLASSFMKIITNQYGCGRIRSIFQLQLTQANYCHYLIEKVVNESNLQKIITDQYGHYIILYLISEQPYTYYATCWNKIIEFINSNFVGYATQKYSSSIIEKCVESTSLFAAQLQKYSVIKELAKDQIGVYVLLAVIHSNEPIVKDTKRTLLKIVYKNKKDVSATATGQMLLKAIKKSEMNNNYVTSSC
jgi:hypothetical protein